jgi:arylsulfatase
MRGRSFADVLTGARAEVYAADDFVSGEMQNGKWIRQGDLKAASVAPPYGPGTWELYDLAEDPGETRNLANEKPDTLDQLVEAWNRYAEDVGVILTGK